MDAKLKAKELVDKFYNQLITITPDLNRPRYQANKFALLSVDEIIKAVSKPEQYEYWQKIKKEIQQL